MIVFVGARRHELAGRLFDREGDVADRMRPNDDALVISRVTPSIVIKQRYSACVWAETITLIAGSRRLAMSAIALPARLPPQPFSAAGELMEPAFVDHEHGRVDALASSSATASLAASASSSKVSPATPVGVTIVGVASRTSPMKPTRMSSPRSPL